MNAKLYKTEKENYVLVDTTKGTYDDGYMLGTSRESQYNKLSIKNCESIERGYDLDEEVSNIVKTIVPDDRGTDIWYGTSMAVGKLCFQKAIELMGDKKFSEEDVIPMIEKSRETGLTAEYLILAKQQTEWDVEVERQCIDPNCDGINRKGECIPGKNPKIDADGCLILKRVK
jgi:hypothetical protein